MNINKEMNDIDLEILKNQILKEQHDRSHHVLEIFLDCNFESMEEFLNFYGKLSWSTSSIIFKKLFQFFSDYEEDFIHNKNPVTIVDNLNYEKYYNYNEKTQQFFTYFFKNIDFKSATNDDYYCIITLLTYLLERSKTFDVFKNTFEIISEDYIKISLLDKLEVNTFTNIDIIKYILNENQKYKLIDKSITLSTFDFIKILRNLPSDEYKNYAIFAEDPLVNKAGAIEILDEAILVFSNIYYKQDKSIIKNFFKEYFKVYPNSEKEIVPYIQKLFIENLNTRNNKNTFSESFEKKPNLIIDVLDILDTSMINIDVVHGFFNYVQSYCHDPKHLSVVKDFIIKNNELLNQFLEVSTKKNITSNYLGNLLSDLKNIQNKKLLHNDMNHIPLSKKKKVKI